MKRLLLACLSPFCLIAFEYQPWFGKLLEFQWRSSYLWSHYHDVDQGFNPTTYSSTDQWLTTGFGISPLPTWDIQIESNFADTKRHSWAYLSTGAYVRSLLLDDVAGDPISWTIGVLLRSVNGHFLNDVSIPYHAHLNLELNTAIGRELDSLYDWAFRFWGLFGAGIGNRGAPWLSAMLNLETNIVDTHRFKLFADGYFGLGSQQGINIDQFNSYANISHQSVDLGLMYRYHFELWGALSASYAYRVFARNYPEHAHTISIEYRLPFSLL